MDDSSTNTLKVFAFLAAVFLIPVAAPELFLLVGSIIWPLYYFYVFINSFVFDATRDLPWHYGAANFFILFWVVISGWATGYMRSEKAGKAMLIFWGPFLMLPTWYTILGLSVPVDWQTYKNQNYIEVGCDKIYKKEYENTSNPFHEVCNYIPQNGKKLPRFAEDITNNHIEKTIPYAKN